MELTLNAVTGSQFFITTAVTSWLVSCALYCQGIRTTKLIYVCCLLFCLWPYTPIFTCFAAILRCYLCSLRSRCRLSALICHTHTPSTSLRLAPLGRVWIAGERRMASTSFSAR